MIHFSSALKFWAKQIDYFKGCAIKPGDYNIRTGASYKKQEGNIGIEEFLRLHWNGRWFKDCFDWITDEKDEDGSMIYVRHKNGLYKYRAGRKTAA